MPWYGVLLRGIDSCKYIIKNKNVKKLKSVIKTGCKQKISKNYNDLNKKNSVFKMQIFVHV